MLFGAGVALFRHDLKAILAYSTISQLGLMVMLLGFGTVAAVTAAVFHILNHAAFKAALFMHAGIVDHETGTRDIRRLGGLAAIMPLTATLGVLAAAAMAGLPPLGGFISKEMMLEEATHIVGRTGTAGARARHHRGLAVGSLFDALRRRATFRRSPHREWPRRMIRARWMLGPPASCSAYWRWPWAAAHGAGGAAGRGGCAAVTGGARPLHLALWHGINPALLMSLGAVAAQSCC
jgi:multicomponent K+:H+ antiporter subunit A